MEDREIPRAGSRMLANRGSRAVHIPMRCVIREINHDIKKDIPLGMSFLMR